MEWIISGFDFLYFLRSNIIRRKSRDKTVNFSCLGLWKHEGKLIVVHSVIHDKDSWLN